ncbi:hypothetical protein HHI36_017267 [Cryptolaemus montrouzieri]|uniref:Uncharacterized protein n=1 Tax=Cryptolaemus montrouzieri TaxID=559131 RepID=A0ABD2NMA6_9CUCU
MTAAKINHGLAMEMNQDPQKIILMGEHNLQEKIFLESSLKNSEKGVMIEEIELDKLRLENESLKKNYEDSKLEKQRLETRIDKLEKKRNILINTLEIVTVIEEKFEELNLEQEKVKSLFKDLRTQQNSLVNAIKLKQGSDRSNPAKDISTTAEQVSEHLEEESETAKTKGKTNKKKRRSKVGNSMNIKATKYIMESKLNNIEEDTLENICYADFNTNKKNTVDYCAVDEYCSDPSKKNTKTSQEEIIDLEERKK